MKIRLLGLTVLLSLFAYSAQATTITYAAVLSGLAEIPANGSPGSGAATVIVDTALNTMEVKADFLGLVGITTASHIHCCTVVPGGANVGVATNLPSFTGFPLNVMSGSYDHIFDMTLAASWNPAFVTAQGGIANAFLALQAGMASGNAYFNIHTQAYPGGEIRGLLHEVPSAAVPEPASLLLAASGLTGAGLRRWRKRRTIA
jgi:CHRD domain/PEP-CTERM motif